MTKRKRLQAVFVTILSACVIAIDQTVKIAVKTGMYHGQHIRIKDWFFIYFTENNGMAFGTELFNKYFLTSFRICAVVAIIWYIAWMIRLGTSWGMLVCVGLVLAGAVGNVTDCVLYGMIFNDPPAPLVAEFVPLGCGYSPILLGKVVDMFYFPLVEWDWPAWMPAVGGSHFIFFRPIFNVADASISCGVISIALFYREKIFPSLLR